ncbi:hypothetical protein GWK47_012720 [Chionoecetes opilio]|uniref:Uncharacterized protein n=1 Tax=Chionoecetes opilio TaxID=41210 RepID=A0A8J4XUL4_CHIOP|nr:hypothetical protein GWK47_012720 [Chionoecetes opilio]
MEYSPLAWSSCPPSYLRLLDRVQARAQRLARLKAPEAAAQIIQPLQLRRDVAGMCVMYKAHRMQLLQLAELRLNPRARPSHSTRAAHNIDHQVTVPFARTEHYLRSFLPRYGRLWNTLVRQTDLHLTTSMHAFKSGGGEDKYQTFMNYDQMIKTTEPMTHLTGREVWQKAVGVLQAGSDGRRVLAKVSSLEYHQKRQIQLKTTVVCTD